MIKKLKPTGYLPNKSFCSDSEYIYGGSGVNLYRWPASSVEESDPDSIRETVYTFDAGVLAIRGWAGSQFNLDDGEIFILTRTGTDYKLWYSTNSGSSFVESFAFPANILLISRGLVVGYPKGVKTYSIAEYNGSVAADVRLLTTTDPTSAWTTKAEWIVTGSNDAVRHMHGVSWDRWEKCFWVCVGDNGTESGIIKWDGLQTIPGVAPHVLRDTYNFTAWASTTVSDRKFKTIDVIPTQEHIYWGIDSKSSPDDSQKGIFRSDKNCLAYEQVDLGDARTVSTSRTMWDFIIVDDQIIATDWIQSDIVGERYQSVYAAAINRAGAGNWREIGRMYMRSDAATNGTNSNVGFYVNNGLIGLSFSRGSGKGTQEETALCRLGSQWIDRKNGPSTINADSGLPHLGLFTDTLHPVYWVKADGDDSNDGYNPSSAFASVEGVLSASTAKVTYGGRLMVDGVTETISDSFDANWFNYPAGTKGYNGESGHPLTVTGAGKDSTVLKASDPHFQAWAIRLDDATAQLSFEDCSIYTESTDSSDRFIQVNADGSQCNLLGVSAGTASLGAGVMRTGTSNTATSYIHQSFLQNNGPISGNVAALDIDGGNVECYSSLIKGKYNGVFLRGSSAGFEAYNSTFLDFDSRGVNTSNSNNSGKLTLVGNVFVGSSSSTQAFNSGTGSLTRNVDANNYCEDAPGQSGDVGTNIVSTDLASRFANSNPEDGLILGSDLLQASALWNDYIDHKDYAGNEYTEASSIGHLELSTLSPDRSSSAGAGTPRANVYVSLTTSESTSSAFTLQPGESVEIFSAPRLGDDEFILAEVLGSDGTYNSLGILIDQRFTSNVLRNKKTYPRSFRLSKTATQVATRIESN